MDSLYATLNMYFGEDYNELISHTFCTLLPEKLSHDEEYLSQIIHDNADGCIGGVEMCYRIFLENGNESITSILVKNDLWQFIKARYGVDDFRLKWDWVKNSQNLFPAKIITPSERQAEMNSRGISLSLTKNSPIIVTNESRIDGAITFFNRDVQRKIAEEIGGDYFAIPSSVHEILAVPDDGYIDNALCFDAMVRNVNQKFVSPDEVLANFTYHYDANEDLLQLSSHYRDFRVNSAEISDDEPSYDDDEPER